MYTAVKTHVKKKRCQQYKHRPEKKNFRKKYGLPVIICNLNHSTKQAYTNPQRLERNISTYFHTGKIYIYKMIQFFYFNKDIKARITRNFSL